jgi:hypothetical protein
LRIINFLLANYEAEKPILEMVGAERDALVLTQDNVNIVADFMQNQGNEPVFLSRFVSIKFKKNFDRNYSFELVLNKDHKI